MRRKATFVKFCRLALLLLAINASAQEYKIRAKVDLVEVPVTIKGSGDKLIAGLTKNDFAVFEDGRRQTIANFTSDPVPLSAAVIIESGLPPESLSKIQKTLTALAGAFSEFDEVAVYRYDKFVTRQQDFSKDHDEILTAINTVRELHAGTTRDEHVFPGPFSIPGPVINGAAVVPPGQVGVIVTTPPRASYVLNDAIFAAAYDLGKRERNRRRIVLVISDGDSSGSEHSFNDVEQSLLERSVQVYAVGVDQPFPYKKLSILSDYARTTGGDVYFENSLKNIEESYASITEEARNQYIIGYLSSNEVVGAGPVFRTISVEVAGRNLKPLHRKGYYQYP